MILTYILVTKHKHILKISSELFSRPSSLLFSNNFLVFLYGIGNKDIKI